MRARERQRGIGLGQHGQKKRGERKKENRFETFRAVLPAVSPAVHASARPHVGSTNQDAPCGGARGPVGGMVDRN